MTEQAATDAPDEPASEPEPKEPKNRNWHRPDIHVALDVRSWERVVAFVRQDATREPPEHWQLPKSIHEAGVDEETVVIFDRVEVSKKTVIACVVRKARIIAFCPIDVPHERTIRRGLANLYPFSEVWTAYTTSGKVLMTCPRGEPYDHEATEAS